MHLLGIALTVISALIGFWIMRSASKEPDERSLMLRHSLGLAIVSILAVSGLIYGLFILWQINIFIVVRFGCVILVLFLVAFWRIRKTKKKATQIFNLSDNVKLQSPDLMEHEVQRQAITVEITVNKPVENVWQVWTRPADIMQWNNPLHDWHSPRVENDLKPGGSFLYRMEAKDGSIGFDHSGKYDKVINNQLIEYTVSDGRKSIIEFVSNGDTTTVVETFEPENENSIEMQKYFCQSVLNNFKKYAEAKIN